MKKRLAVVIAPVTMSKGFTGVLFATAFVVLGLLTSVGSAGAAAAENCVALSGSPSWNDPVSWSCGRVPTSGDHALIGNGSDVRVAASPATNPGSLGLAGGQITFSNEAALAVDGDMVVQGGQIDGAGTLTVNGAFSKGTDATFTVTNDGIGGQSPNLVLNGIGTHGGGQFCVAEAGGSDLDRPALHINNTFSVVDSPGHFYLSPFNCSSLPSIFVNAPGGHLVKAASGTRRFETHIVNTGRISVQTGTLSLQGGTGGETSDGEYVAEAGATLEFAGGFLVAPGGRVGGDGTVRLNGGSVTLAPGTTFDPAAVTIPLGELVLDGASPVSLPSLDLPNGALDTDRPVTVTTLTVNSGRLEGTGSVTVPSGGSFAKVGEGTLFVSSAGIGQESVDLILDGVASHDGGLICVSRDSSHPDLPDLHINNTFTIGAAARAGAFECGPQFGTQIHVNGPNGRLSKVGSGATTFNDLEVAGGTVTIASGQTFRVVNTFSQTGGLTDIASEGILEARPTLTGGVLRGAGRVTGNLTNTSGTVRPGSSPGTLTVTGDYTQRPGGTLEVDVSGTTQGIGYDHLSIGGAASLEGTLAVVQGAGFDPQVTDTFTFLTSASRTGAFSALTGSVLPSGKSYALDYPGSGGARIVVSAAPGGSRPILTDTDPDSPANDNSPRVKGTAPGAATVTLYTSPDCSGTPTAEGTAADFASPGLQVTVSDNSSTTFRATATYAGGSVSACSSSSITYVEESASPPPALGTIVIALDALPNTAQDFSFSGTGGGTLFLPSLLDDDADPTLGSSQTFADQDADSYTFRQDAVPAGWELSGIACSDPDGGSTTELGTRTATIDLDPGETVTCTFTNTQPPPPPDPKGLIEIHLVSGDPQDFAFTGTGPSALAFFTLDDDGLSDGTFNNHWSLLGATAGAWTISQQGLGGWELSALSCTDPDGGSSINLAIATALIDLDADEHIVCTFTNRRLDTTPPTLALPSSFAVDATSSTGAVVAYAVVASDDVDPSPALACAPASGSVFSIGATEVSCSAADSAGNTATGSFTVTVRGAAEQLARLTEKTLIVVRRPARAKALAARLQTAADFLAAGRTGRACSALRTYMTGVELLPVPVVAPLDKAELLADGARIQAVVGC